jgi:succinate-semialdehyde dehydrogenase / glutarate-semialdehyde dehydrogenase
MNQKKLSSTDPATGKLIREYDLHSSAELTGIIQATEKSRQSWQKSGNELRKKNMMRVCADLRNNTDKYARIITAEMGKPLKQSLAEVLKCSDVCEFYAEKSEGFLANEYTEAGGTESFVAFKPLGVILAVMPWNFPFWQVFRFSAPALMAGNGVLLKHASNVTECAMAIEKIFLDAGFPENLFRILKLSGSDVHEVIENPLVKAVTLTGSVEAGRSVAAKAGAALKKTVMELGGSDPYIVLGDADLDLTVPVCVNSRLINSGQSCIAAKRFIAVRSIFPEFLRRMLTEMEQRKMGNPLDEETDLGPQATGSLRDELHKQVLESINMGAECLLGGKVPGGAGWWYPPTVLTKVKKGMPVYEEEIFGPVAAVIEAADEDEAVRIANDTRFGLGAAVFTRDIGRGTYIAEHLLDAGSCFVNEPVRSDPRLPFGGIGHSGYGRELSYFGIREFTNIKTIFVK